MKPKLPLSIVCLVLFVFACNTCNGAEGARRVVAVTSFSNLNKDPAQDWLSVGIAETLTVKLSQVPSLSLVERTRLSDAMKELKLQDSAVVEPSTAAKLGHVLGAQTVVLGAYQRVGEKVRLTARFVDASTAAISNAAQADGEMKDIFDVQDRLAAQMLTGLGVQVSAEVDAKLKVKPTSDIAAYEAYSRGVSSMNEGNYEQAAESLKQATNKDPGFNLAKETLDYVDWARPNSRSAVYIAKVSLPFDQTYDAMLRAVKRAGQIKLHSENRAQGKIVAKQKMNFMSSGQDIDIDLRALSGNTGIRVLSQTRRGFLGMRQKIDWGESRKSIGRILKPFHEEIAALPRADVPKASLPAKPADPAVSTDSALGTYTISVSPSSLKELARMIGEKFTAEVGKSAVKTVAIMDFELIPKRDGMTLDKMVARNVREDLSTALSEINGLKLVERAQLGKALSSLKMDSDAVVDADGAGKLGKLAGADYVLCGSVSDRGNLVVINARMIDTQSGEIKRPASLEIRL